MSTRGPEEQTVPPDDVTELRAEIERLRRLVGPSERSYADLEQDLLAARDAARGAEATAGSLRGQLAQMHVELARARQDQDHLQRAIAGGARMLTGRIGRSVRARLF
jgi:predicted  nucleic acid-binding Zn-ribbon protein